MIPRIISSFVTAVLLCAGSSAVVAQNPDGVALTYQGGGVLFNNVCQSCHMPEGHGAGPYPALSKDAKLTVAAYSITLILNGSKIMPAFGPMLTDQQIADVVNYVRTHFGNSYKDRVAPADVKALRP